MERYTDMENGKYFVKRKYREQRLKYEECKMDIRKMENQEWRTECEGQRMVCEEQRQRAMEKEEVYTKWRLDKGLERIES